MVFHLWICESWVGVVISCDRWWTVEMMSVFSIYLSIITCYIFTTFGSLMHRLREIFLKVGIYKYPNMFLLD